MRVLLALNSYEQDGPGMLVYRLCQRWVPSGEVKVATVALSRGGPLADLFRQLGVATEVVPTRGIKGWKALRRWASRLVKRADCPDLIHTHLLWPDLAMRLVRRELGEIPLVSTCHGLHALNEKGWLKGIGYRLLERSTRSRCRAWIAVSQYVHQSLVEAGYPPDRLFLVRNGVDCVQTYPVSRHRRLQVRQLLNVGEETPIIGAVGTLRKLKGFDVLVEALPAILDQHPETKLFLIGEGPDRASLQARAENLGIARSVRFVGSLSVMLPQVLSTMDVVVHPSRFESFGLVVAEAQACGTPVVATRVGGVPENVSEGETGFLIDPDDPDQISAKVNQLLGDQALRRRMGLKGRAYINAELELGETANKYLEIWREITGQPAVFGEEDDEEAAGKRRLDTREFKLSG